MRATSRQRCRSGCVRSRSRRAQPSAPRSSAERSRRLRAGLAALDLAGDRRAASAEVVGAAGGSSTPRSGETDRTLEELLAERERAEEELAAAAGGSEAATGCSLPAHERARAGRAAAESASRVDLLERDEPRLPRPSQELRSRSLASKRDSPRAAGALERALAEREGLPPAARALAEQGETLASDALEVDAGRACSRSQPRCGHAAPPFVGADEPPAASSCSSERPVRRPRQPQWSLVGRGSVELVRSMPCPRRAPAVSRPGRHRGGFGYDPQRGEFWFAGETAEAFQLELEAQPRAVAAGGPTSSPSRAAVAASPPRDRPMVAPLRAARERLAASARARCARRRAWSDRSRAAPTRAATRPAELAAGLRRLGGAEAELAARQGGRSGCRRRLELARLEAEADGRAAPTRGVRSASRQRATTARSSPSGSSGSSARRGQLGQRQPARAGGVRAREGALAELRRSGRPRAQPRRARRAARRPRPRPSSAASRRPSRPSRANFEEVASTLFPGGEGRLRLTEPDEEEEASAGIEVELRPAGKRSPGSRSSPAARRRSARSRSSSRSSSRGRARSTSSTRSRRRSTTRTSAASSSSCAASPTARSSSSSRTRRGRWRRRTCSTA